MTKDEHNFELSGPSFLKSVEWGNPEHRRIICASLIKGVYTLEHERQHPHQEAMAPSWWKSFNFNVKKELVDDHDSSYYGVVYEFNDSNCTNSGVSHMPPRYVIAFRGTDWRTSNVIQDFKLDINVLFNSLDERKRAMSAIEATKEVLSGAGPYGQVWLAGHSLGSAIALITGRQMVEEFEANMETFLFNPPMVSIPMEHLASNETTKTMMRSFKDASTYMAYMFAIVITGKAPQEASDKLSSWTPHLFLNPSDPISSEYIGHFRHLKNFGWLTRNITAKYSVRCLISTARGKERAMHAYHLMQSANLTINYIKSGKLEAHALHQWWRPDLNLDLEQYKYDLESRV